MSHKTESVYLSINYCDRELEPTSSWQSTVTVVIKLHRNIVTENCNFTADLFYPEFLWRERQGLFHWHCQGPPLTSLHSKSWFSQTILDTPSSSRLGHSSVQEDETQETEGFYFQLSPHSQDYLWWIFLPFFVVMIIEGEQAEDRLRLILSVHQADD